MNITLPKIGSIKDSELLVELQKKINNKTKPVGSLGRLEDLAIRIGQIQQTSEPKLIKPQLVVYAGDHGIVARGVSAFPSDVTWEMVENFLADGAAVSVLARQHQINMTVIDCGVNHDFEPRDRLLIKKVGKGTADSSAGSAMSCSQVIQCIAIGMQIVAELPGNVLILGEMGIGNTSAASLLFSKLENIDITLCAGAGTGLDTEAIKRKVQVLSEALDRHHHVNDPFEVLAALGGFEIATMVGSIFKAAAEKRVILVDGFIVSSAVLVASKIDSAVLDYCIFTHQSGEKGHVLMLDRLKAKPLIDLGLRLGEGSGAMLAWPLIQSACLILNEMASFESAGVSRKS
ncbi:nicotinate-nucleotide--dimethylbenzimidazole phosphoribosyltransferase [Polynucleobacter sp. 15G-AUS-farblos]|uniref:nicotinate-nucleotide--dimethylbenzimidazole phosphoribosyltransferase n=1 Tax=Polynucleobacter sp. 15G-AUS-farblos TaxID=2689094 RepID=UPI001C0D5BB6|nr:nicotinate-nucleotide--dimethylbenzimidazole phosphoribosyltransferase [Polynucleobacter sp. 15G-AUS-farblos]MBU3583310.1 nicotinate-nucleotide--dimethylbenzimidazole phosphoribosyltransferase [Polynucleobacter sp. 15G-AUS-farblos]